MPSNLASSSPPPISAVLMARVAPGATPSRHREDYVLCSGVRSGLKREFVFALKAQAELLITPMSRTRSGKVQHSPAPAPSQEAAAKRRRRSEGAGAPPAVATAPEGSPILPASGDVAPREAKPVAEAAMAVNAGAEQMTDEVTNAALPAAQNNGSAEEASVLMQIDSRTAADTPPRVSTEAGATAVVVQPILGQMGAVVEVPETIRIEAEAMEGAVPSSQVGVTSVAETPQRTPVEAEDTADTLPSIQVDARPVVELTQRIRIEAEAVAGTFSLIEVDARPVAESPQTIPMDVEATADTVLSTQVDMKPVMEMPQTTQIQAEAIEVDARPAVEMPRTILFNAQATTDPALSIQLEAKPLVEVPAEIGNRIPQKAQQNAMPEKPMRRFTRSLLGTAIKPPAPVMEESPVLMAEDSPVASGGSDGLEEIKDSADAKNGADEPLSMVPKKKMELKMSKKIALIKFTSNIRGLLATGLLDGLTVKYATHSFNERGALRGVIKDGGILCFCASCKGLETISAYNFELHAGSKKKHPSDFIYLENGNTIHDILRACSSAPLDMLESTIQNAISSEGSKSLNCDKCKDSSTKSHIGRLASACGSCLVAKLSPASPNMSQESTSIASKAINSCPVAKLSSASPNLSQESTSIARHSRSIFSPKSSDSTSMSMSSQKNSRGRMTRKDLRLHKLVFMDGILPDGTEVGYYSRGQRLLEGYIQGSGIFCHHCKTVISPSLFEAHAGWASRRKPYLNIYTSNGVSLHELSISLSKGKKFSANESDDLCRICADGGDLLLCDLCPRAFHKECVGMTSIPKGDWYCPCCQNMQLKDKSVGHNVNAIAAGRVAGVDPIEQIFKRCIRIVKTPEADVGGCVLCRCHDFSTGFGPRTVLLCDQCEREFHVGCLKEHNMGDLKELPEGKWFCSSDCCQIHAALQKLVASGLEQLPIPHSDVMKKKCEQKALGKEMDLDVRWRLLSGKMASPETRLLLSAALSIFYECFDPVVDFATREDLIPAMVYGWDLRDQDFGGMHCTVLTVNSSVVSAAILRILGCEVAELPLVATSWKNQGKGYFQLLFSCIEGMLDSLEVKHIVLPAADEAESIWTRKFGFSKISADQMPEYLKGYRTMTFQGTSMLHKLVPKSATDG